MALGEVRDMAPENMENRGGNPRQELDPGCKSGGRGETGVSIAAGEKGAKSSKEPIGLGNR